jgi:hypothetical protein
MIVDGVRIESETARWVTLEIYKGCLVVLSRKEFSQGLRRGKWWKRAAALRARQPDAETAADAELRCGGRCRLDQLWLAFPAGEAVRGE